MKQLTEKEKITLRRAFSVDEKSELDSRIRILQVVLHQGPISQEQVIDLLDMKQALVSRHMVRLTEEGILIREPQAVFPTTHTHWHVNRHYREHLEHLMDMLGPAVVRTVRKEESLSA